MTVDLSPRPDRIELVQVRLPLREPLTTATGTVDERVVVLVAAASGDAVGWGEAAPYPGHTAEDVAGVWTALAAAAPGVLGAGNERSASLPSTAGAGLAAALADLGARMEGVALWRALGGTRVAVAAGAAVGFDDVAATLASVARLVEAGYGHVKVKIGPGHDVAVVAAVREAFPDLGIGVDANGSYDRVGARGLAALDDLGVAYLEQPLAAGDLAGHAVLRTEVATPVCLDESVTDLQTALEAIGAGAADVLNVKPGRLGPHAARRVHDAAVAAGVGLRVGGLVETGVGRAHALAVATLPGFTFPADLTAGGHWFTADPVVPPAVLRDGRIDAPETAGIGVAPDPSLLAACTVTRRSFG